MDTLYNYNGLVFWTEKEIRIRQMIADYLVSAIKDTLKTMNRAFDVIQVEAPVLTPNTLINPNYTNDDVFFTHNLALRPETTMGSYQYAIWLLQHTETKTKLPICVWQHGKSFRREQDQVTKNMRLKEFYQLEFQCIYATNTANDYSATLIPAALNAISHMIGPCFAQPSDRLPSYSTSTTDIIAKQNNMEVCSISHRTDFPIPAKVLEIAIGTDRCTFLFLKRAAGGE